MNDGRDEVGQENPYPISVSLLSLDGFSCHPSLTPTHSTSPGGFVPWRGGRDETNVERRGTDDTETEREQGEINPLHTRPSTLGSHVTRLISSSSNMRSGLIETGTKRAIKGFVRTLLANSFLTYLSPLSVPFVPFHGFFILFITRFTLLERILRWNKMKRPWGRLRDHHVAVTQDQGCQVRSCWTRMKTAVTKSNLGWLFPSCFHNPKVISPIWKAYIIYEVMHLLIYHHLWAEWKEAKVTTRRMIRRCTVCKAWLFPSCEMRQVIVEWVTWKQSWK